MEKITLYEARDGERFYYEDVCVNHEKKLDARDSAIKMLNDGKSLLDVYNNWLCGVGLLDHLSEEDKTILNTITKDTPLIIEHLQCCRKPGYCPINLDIHGKVYCWGAAGSWSGSYGSWFLLSDVVRYAKETFKQGETT